jgi:phosphoglycerate kinase
MRKKTIKDVDLKNKKIFMRVDYNVPLNEKLQIIDDTRIKESIPSIKYILEQGASIILVSHLGRPKGEKKNEFSLQPIVSRLSRLIDQEVIFADDCIGIDIDEMKKNLEAGQVLLLENVRFYKEEEENDSSFAQSLISGCDIFVNDAFGTAHRAHASTSGVSKFVKNTVSGFLIEKELNYFMTVLSKPPRPVTAIIGGAKISGKIDVINQLFQKVDNILIGGAMVFTFYKAMGLEVGKSLVEMEKVGLAASLLEKANEASIRLVLPSDILCADSFSDDSEQQTCGFKEIPKNMMGLDIGFDSIEMFSQIIKDSKTIIWNGPMGAFEMKSFSNGTYKITESIASATDKGAISIVGGGDSASAVKQSGMLKRFSHVSTGGGASLELLEGKDLPGIACINNI